TSHRLPWYAPYALEDPDAGERARALLLAAEQRLRAAASQPGLRVWRRVVTSPDVAGAIIHEAERASSDMIVMGGRDHGPLTALGGGVCSEVLRRCRTPLVLVP